MARWCRGQKVARYIERALLPADRVKLDAVVTAGARLVPTPGASGSYREAPRTFLELVEVKRLTELPP